jgi:hypothetical protein
MAPREWRDSIDGDFQETAWRDRPVRTVAAAIAVVIRLRLQARATAPSRPRTMPMFSGVLADLHHVRRNLFAHPGYTLAAALTLAVGIGANVAVFSFANQLLLAPPPGVTGEDRLVTVTY